MEDIRCQDLPPSEYPMHPRCSTFVIDKSFSLYSAEAAKITTNFYNEVEAAQVKFITELRKLLKDSDWK